MSNLTRPELQALRNQHRLAILKVNPNFDGRASTETILNVLVSIGVLKVDRSGNYLLVSSPKKASPKKVSPKKASPKKTSPKKDNSVPNEQVGNDIKIYLERRPLIAQRWQIENLLGKGAFGAVYQAHEGGVAVAIKIFVDENNGRYEIGIIRELYPERVLATGHTPYPIPEDHQTQVLFLVMPLYSISLADDKLLGNLSQAHLDRLVPAMIDDLEYIHHRGILHRDIKPSNFVYRSHKDQTAKKPEIVLIDFGIATHYLNADGSHIAYRTDNPFRGTTRYASINTHLRIEQSRRDDLESLFYTLVYLLVDRLPWQDITEKKKNLQRKMIGEAKQRYPESEQFKGLRKGYQEYYQTVRNLSFEEQPDYAKLKRLLLKK